MAVTGDDGQSSTGDLRFCMEDVVVVMLSKWEVAVVPEILFLFVVWRWRGGSAAPAKNEQ